MQNAEASLEVRYPLPFVVPIRTKKRYPRSGDKRKGSSVGRSGGQSQSGRSTWRETSTSPALVQTCLCAIRKIKEHDAEFTTKAFPVKAQEIFIDAHNALTHSLSVHPVQEMVRGNRYKTLRWHFRTPESVPLMATSLCHRNPLRVTLAVYDRFGRLMMGSEEEPRDVLEYLVLERHLVNHYGMWRLHGKIEPAWAPVKEPIVKTVMILGPELKPGEEFEGLNYEVPKPKAVQWHK
uniref:Mitochondrial ribosomal protein L45 n=1 Tax=Oncorhynchus kisutch TaxID=8019 RepID=A0A8C7CVJ2_ONCKI